MANVQLYVNELIFTGWKSVIFTSDLEAAATSFSVTLSDDIEDDTSVLPVLPGDTCQLALEDEIVLSGYIDGISGKYDAESHEYSMVGRSKIGDLVDCSAIVKGGVFNNQTISQIAQTLCEPFGVKVQPLVDVGAPLKQHRTEDASAHEVIERACRRRGLLLSSSALGELIISEVGQEQIVTPIVKGANVKGSNGRFTHNERFSKYIVKGQADDGGEGWELSQQIHPKGVADDPLIKRYRPLIIDAEDGETDFAKRAQFEATTRLGRSMSITYTLQGWQHAEGLWQINKLVRVVDSYFGIDGWMLISAVTFTLGKNGTTTDITVIPKEAFTVKILKVKDAKGSAKKGSNKSAKKGLGGWGNVNVYD
jgi:prophage tail gpP-like protein